MTISNVSGVTQYTPQQATPREVDPQQVKTRKVADIGNNPTQAGQVETTREPSKVADIVKASTLTSSSVGSTDNPKAYSDTLGTRINITA